MSTHHNQRVVHIWLSIGATSEKSNMWYDWLFIVVVGGNVFFCFVSSSFHLSFCLPSFVSSYWTTMLSPIAYWSRDNSRSSSSTNKMNHKSIRIKWAQWSTDLHPYWSIRRILRICRFRSFFVQLVRNWLIIFLLSSYASVSSCSFCVV